MDITNYDIMMATVLTFGIVGVSCVCLIIYTLEGIKGLLLMFLVMMICILIFAVVLFVLII